MLKDYLKDLRDTGRCGVRAVAGKTSAVITGIAPVAPTCQVPGLRAKYEELGLPVRGGLFVEIGAFDGESWSNTSFLADQGWRGVYVEPVPKYFRRMRLRHALNQVSGENVGIADKSGVAEISMMGPLSTMSEATATHYRSLDWAQIFQRKARAIQIKTDTISAVLTRNNVPPDFDLMVIDVEGGEEPIVRALLATAWRPRVLIIELCDVHPDFSDNAELAGSHARVRAALLAAGYGEYFVHPINSIFRRA